MSTKIAFVTGCSSGIGLATVTRLARDPTYVVIATVIAMSESTDLESAVGDALDKTVFIKALDITNDDNITQVVDDVINTHGRIDMLMNIAGLAIVGLPERMTRKQIDLTFNVNTIGTIRLTQAVLPHMKKKKTGKIVTVSSTCGKIGYPYFDIYCSSKFALEGFFESLAAGLRAFNISVCLVEPAGVSTGLYDGMCSRIEEQSQDESVDDIDQKQLSVFLGALKESLSATSDDIAKALIARCLEVEKPDFRHLLAENYVQAIGQSVADLSGETAVRVAQSTVISTS